ncbi:hypothetical protein [Paracoccus sp. SCSIO 75233]|uniref:hypothetical protein n=1 Tax=Paracoccus sp. SCSIO 75233 TaxID=3017782 RepID=UPI0022F08679|nr:hypothetical protein [Paracoccus sp. SCSIO 75233]WBU54167.1 hypothetical protein PAF12_04855 [Paracoccus sp. SCSIO 75233]
MKRTIKTFEHRPLAHIIESETVDLDNRSLAFTVFGHEDPDVVTLEFMGTTLTRSRACLTEGMERILKAIKEVPNAR